MSLIQSNIESTFRDRGAWRVRATGVQPPLTPLCKSSPPGGKREIDQDLLRFARYLVVQSVPLGLRPVPCARRRRLGAGKSLQVISRQHSSKQLQLRRNGLRQRERFLSAACKSVDLFGTSLKPQSNWRGSAPGFSIQTSFAGLFSNNTAPSNFLPAVATGDTSLLDTVNSGNGRIGYTGPDVMANPDDATKVARVIGFSPKDVSIPATIGTVSPPTSAQDIADPLKWAPNIAYPSTGYPIVGFTNLIIGQCYKRPIVASAIRSFLFNHYGSAGDSSQDQGPNDATLRAHWFYPLDRTWREAIRTRFALASSSTGLNNPGACNGIGRP
jgi:hypothetical protein